MIDASDRREIMQWIDDAVQQGASREACCDVLGLSSRVLRKWRASGTLVDGRTKAARALSPRAPSPLALSQAEKDKIRQRFVQDDVLDMSINQAYWWILDHEGKYYASLRTVYRVMEEDGLVTWRNAYRKPRKSWRPKSYQATGPNQVWTWDITYFRDANYSGKYYYGFVVVDIFSRYVVHSAVYKEDNACEFLAQAFKKHHIKPRQLVLHSDNGASMKATDTLALLESNGVEFSHSRPRVSNDNPYSESLFRTLKYTGMTRYPTEGFTSLEAAQKWLAKFILEYNEEHYHCGINNVTPGSRFRGEDKAVLEKRRKVIEEARQRNPRRWINGRILNCDPVGGVWLNPDNAANSTQDSPAVAVQQP